MTALHGVTGSGMTCGVTENLSLSVPEPLGVYITAHFGSDELHLCINTTKAGQ